MRKPLTGTRLVLFIFALMLAEMLGAFELSMLFAAMRHLIAEFHDPGAVGWVITAFMLASALSAALGGRLGDMFGRQQLLVGIIAISIVGSLVAGFADSLSMLIFGRVLQGTSGAIYPLCIGLVRENVNEKRAPLAIGLLAATITVSAGVGLLLGGVLVDNLSWRWIFYAGAATAVVSAITMRLWVPKSATKAVDPRTNWLGGILFAPAIGGILLALSLAPVWGWTSPATLGLGLTGTVLLAIWATSEWRSPAPLIDVRLLGQRQILLCNLAFGLMGMTVMQWSYIGSLLLQQPAWTVVGLGVSATLAGLVLFPANLAALLGGPAAGWMMPRYGGRLTMGLGALIMTLSWIVLAFKHDTLGSVLLIMFVQGFGLAIAYASVPMLIVQSAPMERTSEATGMTIVVRGVLWAIGAQLIAFLLASSTVTDPDSGARYADGVGFMRVFAFVAAGSALVVVTALLLPRYRPDPVQSQAQP